MSQGNEIWTLKPSQALRDRAAALVEQIHTESHPGTAPELLIRVAMVEAGLAALHHLETADPDAVCQAVAEAVVMTSRLIAASAKLHDMIVLQAIALGMGIYSKRDDLGKIVHPTGPKKEAS